MGKNLMSTVGDFKNNIPLSLCRGSTPPEDPDITARLLPKEWHQHRCPSGVPAEGLALPSLPFFPSHPKMSHFAPSHPIPWLPAARKGCSSGCLGWTPKILNLSKTRPSSQYAAST